MDADLSHDPDEIPNILDLLRLDSSYQGRNDMKN